MSEEINVKELAKKTRPEIEEVAVSLGLVGAATYQNKPSVLDAIAKVQSGEVAAEVDAAYTVTPEPTDDSEVSNEGAPAPVNVSEDDDDSEDDSEEDDDNVESDKKTSDKAPKKVKKDRVRTKTRNQGHATHFDENGAPLF